MGGSSTLTIPTDLCCQIPHPLLLEGDQEGLKMLDQMRKKLNYGNWIGYTFVNFK